MDDFPDDFPLDDHDPTVPPPPAQHAGAAAQAATVAVVPGSKPRKPGKLTAVAILMLVSGIINCLWSLYFIVLAIPTMCLSLIALPLILTTGILEIVHASKLLKDPIHAYKPATSIAVLEICCILTCNMYALVAGILGLIFCGDPEVKQYYRDAAISRGYQPQV